MIPRTGQSRRSVVLFLAFLVALAAGAPDAFGQGIGFQGGVSVDPEQAYFGSHFETREIARGLHLRPSIDGAFGGGLTVGSINADFIYKYAVGRAWKIYQGGGPAVHIFREGEPAQTDVTGGLAGVFGFAHDNGFFVEFKAGGGGGANLKFGVGFTLR